MGALFSDKDDIEVVVDALEDALDYNECLAESERRPDVPFREQPPEVREALRKAKRYMRLLTRLGRRRDDLC